MSTSLARFCPPAVATLVLFATLLASAGDAAAQRRADDRGNREGQGRTEARDDSRRHDGRAEHRALSDAVRRVERRTGGQVLSAERVPFDGRDVNRVKVVDSTGRVRVYMDDPRATRNDPPRTRRDDD